MQQCRSHGFSETLQGELWCTVQFVKGTTHESKMAAVVDDMTTLPRFHAWENSLDQAQSSKEVHFEQVLGHLDRDTLQHGRHY